MKLTPADSIPLAAAAAAAGAATSASAPPAVKNFISSAPIWVKWVYELVKMLPMATAHSNTDITTSMVAFRSYFGPKLNINPLI